MKAKTLSSLPSKTDDITPTHLGIGKSEEVRALERNLTEEIILDEHFVLKPTEEGVLPESFPNIQCGWIRECFASSSQSSVDLKDTLENFY